MVKSFIFLENPGNYVKFKLFAADYDFRFAGGFCPE